MSLDAWENSCSKTEVIQLLRNLVPPPYASLQPEIEKAFNILEGYMKTFVLPGCPDTNGVAGMKNHFPQQYLYLAAMAALALAVL